MLFVLTQGSETCQHQNPEHVCVKSEQFCKKRMLLSSFMHKPDLDLEWKVMHLWFVSHTVSCSPMEHASWLGQWWKISNRYSSSSKITETPRLWIFLNIFYLSVVDVSVCLSWFQFKVICPSQRYWRNSSCDCAFTYFACVNKNNLRFR